jgi:DNA-binding SARP family transcriptional activator
LLLALGGAGTRQRMVALLWPELDEATGRRNLRRELARLRDIGAGDVLQVDGDRLALAASVQVDVTGFHAALMRSEPEAALALWRGPPAEGLDLDDVPPYSAWWAAESERLRAARRAALAAAAAAAEAEGRADAALAWSERLLEDDPLQEAQHRAVMRLLAAAGRREAALARYQRCCELLQSELGLAPMAETEALAASLRAPDSARAASQGAPHTAWPPSQRVPDPASDASRRIPPTASTVSQRSQMPAGAARAAGPRAPTTPAMRAPAPLVPEQLPFVGRSAEVAWLERAWAQGCTVLIEGEGGVGKSRLAIDFAAAHGPCAVVHCRPGDAELPLASLARALRVLAGPAPALDELPDWVRGELARLLPELGAPAPPLRGVDGSNRFSQACSIAWQAWAVGNFDAVVVDDWHLADPASRALLMQLADGPTAAVRQLLVARPEAGDAAAALRQRLVDAGARLLRLEPLPPDAIFDLVRQLSGAARPARFAALLARATAGHPFYVAETLRHLVEIGLLAAGPDGVWRTPFDQDTEDYAELPLPASVRDAVLSRVQRLPQTTRRVLEAAALAAEPFSAALLAPACALSEVEAALALEAALDARLLREHGNGGLAFAHDLVQQALESSLGVERCRSVHRRLALGAAAAGAAPARVAAHHEAGGEPARAVAWRRRAAEDAMRLNALDEAIPQWQQALADGPAPADELALRASLMRTLELRSLHAESQAQGERLLALADGGAGSPHQRLEARIQVAAMHARREDGSGQRALALLDGLPSIDDLRLQALALHVRSDALRALGRVGEALELGNQALGCSGLHPEERFQLLDSLAICEFHRGHIEQARDYVEQSLALSRSTGDGLGEALALCRRGAILSQMGDLAAAEPVLIEAAERVGRFGLMGHQRGTLFNLCVLYSAQSRPADVLQAARQAWETPPPMPQEAMRTQLRLAFVEAHVALGDLGQAWHWTLGAIDDAVAVGQTIGHISVLLTCAELLAVLGQGERLAPVRAALAGGAMDELRSGSTEMWVVQAECALMDGDLAAARTGWQAATAVGVVESDRVGARLALVDAALQLADGQPAAALQRLPDAAAPGLNDELRWRSLAVRLRAEAALAGVQPATRAATEQALTQQGVHAVAALVLHHALVSAAPSAAQQAAWRQRVDALAATLKQPDAPRGAFLRRWVGAA